VVIALLAGLMAKATLVTVPVLLLLLDCWPLCRLAVPGLGDADLREAAARRYPPRPWQAVLVEKLPLLLLSVIFIAVTLHTQKTAIRSPTDLPLLSARLPNAVHATAWYVWKTVWPTGLHAFYGHPGRVGWPPVVLASAVATLSFLAAAAVRWRSSVPAVAVGLVWFAVALSPVIGIVAQQGSQAQADRYSYVPHIGLMISVVWSAAAAAARLRVPTWMSMIVLMVVSAVFVAIDQRLIPTWKNSTALWSRVLTVEPGNARARYHYGNALSERGEVSAAIGEFQTALATLQAAANTSESQSEVCTALGVALLDEGKTPEAVEQFHRAITLDPTNTSARMEVGCILLNNGRPKEAAGSFATILAAESANVDAARNLVIAEARAGDLPAATAACRRLVVLLPGQADSHSRLGQLLLQGGSIDQAIEEFRVAAQLDPGHPGIFSLLSRAYAAAGRPEEAEQAAARDRLQVREQSASPRQGH
jgi:Flp pilus assembly protein TadD